MFIEIKDSKDIEDIAAILRLMIERGYTPYVELGARRSAAQNRKFHALCRELSRTTGYTPAEIKQWVKQKVLGDINAKIRHLDQDTFSRMIEEMENLRQFINEIHGD